MATVTSMMTLLLLLLGSISQMRTIVTDRVAWSVGPSVCHCRELGENGLWAQVLDIGPDSPMEPCVRWRSRFSHGRGSFGGGDGAHCIV